MTKMKDEVNRLLEKYAISKPPISVDQLARALNIELRYVPHHDDEEKMSGILFREKDRTVVGVNASESRNRQRFTIAHELGHFVLHGDQLHVDTQGDVFLRNEVSSRAIDNKEIEANRFAAELLMPEPMVRKQFKEERSSLDRSLGSVPVDLLIEGLAERFEVSEQAMTFRLANLRLINLRSPKRTKRFRN